MSRIGAIFDTKFVLHTLKLTYRDCTNGNVMMDPEGLFPQAFHPSWPSRLASDMNKHARHIRRSDIKKPARYYFIDFGLSTWFRDTDSDKDPPQRTTLWQMVRIRAPGSVL